MSKRCEKSASKSTGRRNSGNEAFGRKKVIEALRLYNQALQSAPHLSPEFFLALGNRSAALRDLNKLKECAEDIDRVLEAQESSTIPTSTLERLRARRSEVLSQLHVKEEDDRATESAPQLFIGCNPSVPSLSKAVDIRFSKEKGRHLIANRKLAKGSVVIVEDPYAKVLLPHCALSHCHFCCRELPLNHLPCTTCIEEVNFCNEQCRDEALLKFHSIECGNVEKLNNIGLGYLAVRLVLCSDVDQLIEYDLASDRVKSMQRVFGSSPADVYSSSDFRSVASLESHDDDGETASNEEVELTAVKLTRFLRENGYFSSARCWPANISTKEQDVIVVRALVGLVRRLICNAHAVTKVVDSLPYTTDETESQEVLDRNEVYIASGLFPTTSLANHSCIPNLFSRYRFDTFF
uniref:SET domain-containing protein n=1 Tax=Plectus sambesii TaxID=2011161 RepID=A0A914UI58_9BILA